MTFPTDIAEREAYILQQVLAGQYAADWNPIDSFIEGHTARFWVMTDALKVEGVRVSVSATLEQQIADAIGASLLTPKLADLLHDVAEVVIGPLPRTITSSTEAMLDQDKDISAAIAKVTTAPKGAIISTVGKHWVIDQQWKTTTKAINYGWHFKGTTYQGIKGYPCPSGLPYSVIQPSSTAHDAKHVDYSQVCVLVLKACLVDGQLATLADVLTNPVLCKLACHNGPLTILRQSGVPEPADKSIVLPEVVITADPDGRLPDISRNEPDPAA